MITLFRSHNDADVQRLVPVTLNSEREFSGVVPLQQSSSRFEFSSCFPDRLEIKECLNRGGQGAVYRAWDHQLQRDVAIKLGHPRSADSSMFSANIQHESRWIVRINHPRLPTVYESGHAAGRPYVVFEYIPGLNLQEYTSRHTPGRRQILRFMREISEAVSAAHRAGVLHLDLKPENVMVTPDGHCKLIDFGLAWEWGRRDDLPCGFMAGTSPYLAPEQASGDHRQWTEATDVFGLGAILHELLMRKPPLAEWPPDLQTHREQLQICREQLLQKSRQHLHRVCWKALHPDPRERFESVKSFCRALRADRIRNRRVAGLLFVVAGIWMFLHGLHSALSTPPARQRKEQTAASSIATPLSQELKLRFEIRTDMSARPQVFVWSPSWGIQEIRGLREREFAGSRIWSPRSRDGEIRAHLPDENICLLMISNENDRAISVSQITPAVGCVQNLKRIAPGETVRVTSDRSLDVNDGELREQLTDLQKILQQLNSPCSCLIATVPHRSQSIWRISEEFDFTRPTDAGEGLQPTLSP
ncbi:serine/threonine protein kinase [Planctomicrobium sp. SH661]|uniref:serine/threonine protein kinase n=1 Tax=Planctomicrobium sp. SH661 TaxID=3448124 RepID=UPI003F5B7F81